MPKIVEISDEELNNAQSEQEIENLATTKGITKKTVKSRIKKKKNVAMNFEKKPADENINNIPHSIVPKEVPVIDYKATASGLINMIDMFAMLGTKFIKTVEYEKMTDKEKDTIVASIQNEHAVLDQLNNTPIMSNVMAWGTLAAVMIPHFKINKKEQVVEVVKPKMSIVDIKKEEALKEVSKENPLHAKRVRDEPKQVFEDDVMIAEEIPIPTSEKFISNDVAEFLNNSNKLETLPSDIVKEESQREKFNKNGNPPDSEEIIN